MPAFVKLPSFWQIVSGFLLCLLVIQCIRIDGFSVRLPLLGRVGIIGLIEQAEDARKQAAEYKQALDKLVAESKAQQKQVGRTITHYVTVTKPDAEKRAKEIEAAPLPGNCRTPPQIMDLDI